MTFWLKTTIFEKGAGLPVTTRYKGELLMKTRKNRLIVVFVLLVSWTLMILGCLDGPPESEPPITPTPPSVTEPTPNIIRNQNPPDRSKGDIEFTPTIAVKDTKIEIKLKPNTGYEPYDLMVYNRTNNIPIDLSPAFISDVYNYSFTMPDSQVEIYVTFIPILEAIANETNKISSLNDWDKIDALNILIGKVQNQSSEKRVEDAIDKLVGEVKYPPTIPAGGGTPPPLPPPTLPAGAPAWTWEYIGIVRTKMRNADLTSWLPLSKWPSDKIEKGVDITTDADSDGYIAGGGGVTPGLGADRTILYYVKEDTDIPQIALPGKIWEAARYDNVPSTSNVYPLVQNLDGVMEYQLVYRVGIDDQRPINYRIWLVPVAQYTLQNDTGAQVTVDLEDYEFANYNWTAKTDTIGGKRTLGESNSQVTGYVGDVDNPGNPAAAPDQGNTPGDRKVAVKISTTRPNVLISVYYANTGNLVLDYTGKPLNFISNAATGTGYFYPESRQYTIRVRSSTPPIGM